MGHQRNLQPSPQVQRSYLVATLLVQATETSHHTSQPATATSFSKLDCQSTRQGLSEEFLTRQYGLDGRFTSSIIPYNGMDKSQQKKEMPAPDE
jgi:hypothetical protein